MKNILIIGAGFSGLYASYLTGGTLIAAEDKQSRMMDKYIFLRYDLNIRKLLTELELPFAQGIFKIGYFCDHRVYRKPTKEMIENYYKKAYPERDIGWESLWRYNKNEYFTCDIAYSDLIEKLKEKTVDQTIKSMATQIDMERKEVTLANGQILSYNALISTIPLPYFALLAHFKLENLRAQEIHLYDAPSVPFTSNWDFNQVMNMDSIPGILRWVYTPQGWTEESLIKQDKTQIAFIQFGKIAPRDLHGMLELFENEQSVFMAGRNAQWYPHYDTEDSIVRVNSISKRIK